MVESEISKPDKEILRKKYNEFYLKYERLATNLKLAFESFLHETGIDVLDVTYRIKDFESFWEKIQRKGYKDPIKEIEDICGLRIICFYPSDLEKISKVINNEFYIKESVDKADLLEPDKFGYRSLHFILTLKDSWLQAPNYRGLGELKAEVQVRTILMHAWADIEHKLAYKKKEDVPDQFKRKLYQLSALFEIADEQFDLLRKNKEEYRQDLISEKAKQSGRFDINQPMNLDSLQAFLDFYFPDRNRADENTRNLLDEIIMYEVSMKELVEAYEALRDILPAIEEKTFTREKGVKWAQVGIVRTMLEFTNDRYWDSRNFPQEKWYVEWRAEFSKNKHIILE